MFGNLLLQCVSYMSSDVRGFFGVYKDAEVSFFTRPVSFPRHS